MAERNEGFPVFPIGTEITPELLLPYTGGELAKFEPYIIVRLFGPSIHLSNEALLHLYRSQPQEGGKKRFVHMGGKNGVDLRKARRMHEESIKRYIGIQVKIPASEIDQNLMLKQSIASLEEDLTVEFEGELDRISKITNTLRTATRKLTRQRDGATAFEVSREFTKILEGPLARVIDPNKVALKDTLNSHVNRDSYALLEGATRGQKLALVHAQRIMDIVEALTRRFGHLDNFRRYQNQAVSQVSTSLSLTKDAFDGEDTNRISNNMSSILGEIMGIEVKLSTLIVEPYYTKAQTVLKAVNPLREHWERRDMPVLKRIINKQAYFMETWRESISQEISGTKFDAFRSTPPPTLQILNR